MLMLLGAVAEFGRFFYTYQTLSKATRAGARYLTTEPAAGAADARAKNLVVYGNESGAGAPVVSGLAGGNVRVMRTGGTSAFPERVTVRIEGYTYQPVFDLGKLIGSPTLSLRVPVSPSTTMRFFSSIPS
jgi:Flp pilus assembly protein TadG